jgi:hypothetical protein
MELCFAKTLYSCPNCESSMIRRSMRRGFVERVFLRLTLVWPYRCDDCDLRFWGFQRQVPAQRDARALGVV